MLAKTAMVVHESLSRRINWSSIALKLHEAYRGKIEIQPKVPFTRMEDSAIWYTPGVAAPCKAIKESTDESFRYTLRWNYIAVISDGTRVLGLGNIGPEAGLPVMEGKALLFKYLGGVDAIPLVVRVESTDEFINIVKALEPSFGGFNLEDIESPKCFYILEKLRESLNVPVWHDDQQGTATVVLAALYSALKLVGKKISEVKVAQIGVGAAGIPIIKYLVKAGVKPGNIIAVDSKGILHRNRSDLERMKVENPWKYRVAIETNSEDRTGGVREALREADVVIAVSKPGPGVIKKEWISSMADNPIVFALANPIPEIWPWEAEEAGAAVIATGRSDFPNQVNNSLVFPAVFRGALTVMARKITDEMCLAAARAIADYVEEKGIRKDYIVPSMSETEVYVREAVAVAREAIDSGVARRALGLSELEEEIRSLIERPKKYMNLAVKHGFIKIFEEYYNLG